MDERTFLYQGHGYGLFLGGMLFERGIHTIGTTLFPAGPGRTSAAIQGARHPGAALEDRGRARDPAGHLPRVVETRPC